MNPPRLRQFLKHALREDLGFGDLSSSIFPQGHVSSGTFVMKADGIIAGLDIIHEVYRQLSPDVKVEYSVSDGDRAEAGTVIASAKGPAAALLSGERTILNLVQHLSGVATNTYKAVKALNSEHTKVCDTRKTLPGLRMLQKYAVRCGGGYNHRFRLDDGIMIKDNHIKAAGSISKAIEKARKAAGPMVRIEVETENREQVQEAVDAGADIIMFDNRTPQQVKDFVSLVPDEIITEVSGGITLETIGGYRETGVDFISLGFLTHTVSALDISFNLKS